ncbi:MAG: DUF1080 domain-containing protein [Candidatus Omnitrophota bacterium]
MKRICVILFFFFSIFFVFDNVRAAEPKQGERFVPLFNGTNLDGWSNVNGYPETWTARDGMIVCSGIPTGILRTDKPYENFILELDWLHVNKGGNGGVFIYSDALPARGAPFTRSIQIQVKEGNGGDIYPIHGATMSPDKPHPEGWARSLPSEDATKPAGNWNHYRIESRDGMVSLTVNGKLVTRGFNCNPRKGYICLEAEDKSEVHYRNIQICELSSSNPSADAVASLDQGFRALSGGKKLSSWKNPSKNWHAEDWILYYDGQGAAGGEDPFLWSTEEFNNFILIADWRFPAKPELEQIPVILPNGSGMADSSGQPLTASVLSAGQGGICLRGNPKASINLWNWPIGSGGILGYMTDASLSEELRKAVTPIVNADNYVGQWNRVEITVIESQVNVTVNGKTAIQNAWLQGIPQRGPIALQHFGKLLLFTNVFVKELSWSEIFGSMKQF